LNDEIDELMAIDPFHNHHFAEHRPTVDQWKKRRNLYIEHHNLEELDDVFNMDKEQWFNDLKITIYVRDHQHPEHELEEIKRKLK